MKNTKACKNKLHVFPWKNKWRVKRENTKRAIAIFIGREEAILCAIKIINKGKASVMYLHNKDGTVNGKYERAE